MKRANGTGTIYKMSGQRRLPWAAMVTIDRKRREYIGFYSKRKDAEAALAAWLACPTDKPNITLLQMHEEWQGRHYRDLSKQTKDNYNAAWSRLEPLAERKVKDIRTAELQAIIDGCEASHSTKAKIKTLMGLLWDYALENDIVTKNYAKFVRLKSERKTEKRFFNSLELAKIDKAAKKGEMAQLILLLCHTGFRINELLSLTPFDLIRNEDGSIYGFRGGLKTEAGKGRTVPVKATDIPCVQKWLDKCGKYIFCNQTGDRWRANAFRDQFAKTIANLGIAPATPHATRHTFFSLMAAAGISEAITMRIGGHADPNMTKHYTHAELMALQAAVNKIAR